MSTRINQAQLARALGITKQSVREFVVRGVIQLDENGLLDPEQAKAAILAAANPAHAASRDTVAARLRRDLAGAAAPAAVAAPAAPAPRVDIPPPAPDGEPGALSFQVARTLRERYSALEAKLDYEARLGQLVERKAVESAWFSVARQTLEALEAVADRISGQLAAESDPHRVREVLRTELLDAARIIARFQPVPTSEAA